ncbi:MAG: autotransporter outer membrane beta-barrel domain-containing protein [Planctomycetaceae bacterium]|jgi:hypothetical protein|nr:autotransporter outer membrane beta-barrel domain-containing protein [Planctomycetaceae bacterium]
MNRHRKSQYANHHPTARGISPLAGCWLVFLFLLCHDVTVFAQSLTSMVDATLPLATRRNIVLNNTAIFKRLEEFTFHNPGTPTAKPYNVWNEMNGDIVDRNDDSDIYGYNLQTLGSSFGGEMRAYSDFVIGANMGLFQPNLTSNDQFSRAKGSLMMLSVHSAWFTDYWSVKSMIGYGYGDYNAERLDTKSTTYGLGNRQQNSFFAAAEVARRFRYRDFWFIPSYTFNYVHTDGRSYSERGLNDDKFTFNRQISSGYLHTLAIELELDYYHDFHDSQYLITPSIRAAWVHDASSKTITSTGNNGDTTFSVNGARIIPNILQLGAGLTINVEPKYLLFCRYDTEISDKTNTHHLSAGYGVFW